jgi:hypothetical protein
VTEGNYQRVEKLISSIRNAEFGETVAYVEELLGSGLWQDYTAPNGSRYQFRSHEFDYFLAVMEIDPTVIRYAYLKATGVDKLHLKLMHLSDVTGRGHKITAGQRRPRTDVAREYAAYPDGAGARIKSYGSVVTDRTAQVAADPERRQEYEATGRGRERAGSKYWRVSWSGATSVADAIAAKLLADPPLAREVYDRLDARYGPAGHPAD